MKLQLKRPDWFTDALCATTTFRLFFVTDDQRGGPGSKAWEDDAKAVCDICPVQMQCQRQGFYEEGGIWGGWNEGDRSEVRIDYRAYKGIGQMVRNEDFVDQLVEELYG